MPPGDLLVRHPALDEHAAPTHEEYGHLRVLPTLPLPASARQQPRRLVALCPTTDPVVPILVCCYCPVAAVVAHRVPFYGVFKLCVHLASADWLDWGV